MTRKTAQEPATWRLLPATWRLLPATAATKRLDFCGKGRRLYGKGLVGTIQNRNFILRRSVFQRGSQHSPAGASFAGAPLCVTRIGWTTCSAIHYQTLAMAGTGWRSLGSAGDATTPLDRSDKLVQDR